MDTTILVPSCPKVNQLYIKIKFDIFEQLMLHYDFCAFSFSELLDWIKPCVEIIWKIWRNKKIDWGPSPSHPNVLHQATTSLLVQRKKESKSNTFWMLDSDCRIELSCNGCHDFIRTLIGGVPGLHGKLKKSTFIRIQNHVHIFSEASAIVDLLQRPFLSTVLRHLILDRWGVYQVAPNRDAS
jgi:hypothetical protein